MANRLISPGVATNEIDQSFLPALPVQVGAAIIGPTVKGPVEIPTIVTSYSDFQNTFGRSIESGSDSYSFFTNITAYNYFQNGGTSLLVARVVSGSYTPATSSIIQNLNTSASFTLETISEGTIMNSDSAEDGNGALANGTKDNLRWEIVNSNTGSGTFALQIRRGDDRTNDKYVLEAFANLSLDPNSDRFISKIIGDQTINYNSTENQLDISGSYPNASKYVRVKSVSTPTLNYLDNSGVAKNVYTGSIPINASGTFSGATGTIAGGANFYENINSTDSQGLVGANYDNMVNLLSNKDDYQFNLLVTPGITKADHSSQVSSAVTNTISRGDNIYIVDLVGYSATQTATVTQAGSINTSYAATYWPWVKTICPETGKRIWAPASVMMPGVYAFNDRAAAPWNAPAGINRGGLSNVIRPKVKLSTTNRDTLYDNNINPIATFPKHGVVVFGQKTLQKEDSALDRVNVRRLMIELKGWIGQIADTLVFEQNTLVTRNKFINQVRPYLENIQQKGGLYAFDVRMDETNNTPDVIDRNQLVGQIAIQPSRTAEFITLDFIVQRTGAEFPF